MDDMERAAMAVYYCLEVGPREWSDLSGSEKRKYRNAARRAVEAHRGAA